MAKSNKQMQLLHWRLRQLEQHYHALEQQLATSTEQPNATSKAALGQSKRRWKRRKRVTFPFNLATHAVEAGLDGLVRFVETSVGDLLKRIPPRGRH